MRIVDLTAELNFQEVDALLNAGETEGNVDKTVRQIIDDVRRRGDDALCD